MQAHTVSIPTLAMIAGTRGMLGAGIGLLLASRLSAARRRGMGQMLVAAGVLSTIPLALKVFRSQEHEGPEGHERHQGHDAFPAVNVGDTDVPVRRGRHQMLPIKQAGTVEAQRR